jgi:hypothetical protein
LLISRKSRKPFNRIRTNDEFSEDRILSSTKNHTSGQITDLIQDKFERKMKRDMTPQETMKYRKNGAECSTNTYNNNAASFTMYFPNMTLNTSTGNTEKTREVKKYISKRDNNWNSFTSLGKHLHLKQSPYIAMGNQEEPVYRSNSSHSNHQKLGKLIPRVSHVRDNIKISDESVLAISEKSNRK